MQPLVLDLFGEIPVTEDEIFQWVAAVAPRWASSERSFHNYVQSYNVPDKIRAAKARGDFDLIISQRVRPWHARLSLDAII